MSHSLLSVRSNLQLIKISIGRPPCPTCPRRLITSTRWAWEAACRRAKVCAERRVTLSPVSRLKVQNSSNVRRPRKRQMRSRSQAGFRSLRKRGRRRWLLISGSVRPGLQDSHICSKQRMMWSARMTKTYLIRAQLFTTTLTFWRKSIAISKWKGKFWRPGTKKML